MPIAETRRTELPGHRRGLDEALRDALGEHLRRPGKQDQELIAADTKPNVTSADRFVDRFREVAQQLVSGVVAEGVIHLLQAVDVDRDDAERKAGARGIRNEASQVFRQRTTIRQVRERIGHRHRPHRHALVSQTGGALGGHDALPAGRERDGRAGGDAHREE